MRRFALLAVAAAAVLAPSAARTAPATIVTVAHGPVTPQNSEYIDIGAAGPSVGDLRTYYIPLTQKGRAAGYLTGTLTTVAVNRPSDGMELRTANLVFVVGRASDQIVVGGVAAYAQTAPAVATRSSVTRPVIGG